MAEQRPDDEIILRSGDVDFSVVRVHLQRDRVPIMAAIMAWPDEVFDWFVAGLMFTSSDAARLPSHVREKAEQLTELVLAYSERKARRRPAKVHSLPPRGGG